MGLQIKRVYAPAEKADGQRILVDRLWPRGVSKERAALDGWLKDIAPSTSLRRSFGHSQDGFDVFRAGYRRELSSDPVKKRQERELLDMARQGTVTLLYAARDEVYNHAAVLLEYLNELELEKGK